MKALVLAQRNWKEILRDPLNIAFGLGFPLAILLLLSAIQARIPIDLFRIDQLVPGVAVFGLSFISLFSATLISKDRTTSFLARLLASPLTATDFILGYTLPMLPIAVLQVLVCYITAFFLGLPVTFNVVLAIVVMLPTMIFFIALGLLCGTIFNDKQVGGICGALLTNLSGWLSGTWFDLKLVGGWFERIAGWFPFAPAVEATRATLNGNYANISHSLIFVTLYAVITCSIAVGAFQRRMREDI